MRHSDRPQHTSPDSRKKPRSPLSHHSEIHVKLEYDHKSIAAGEKPLAPAQIAGNVLIMKPPKTGRVDKSINQKPPTPMLDNVDCDRARSPAADDDIDGASPQAVTIHAIDHQNPSEIKSTWTPPPGHTEHTRRKLCEDYDPSGLDALLGEQARRAKEDEENVPPDTTPRTPGDRQVWASTELTKSRTTTSNDELVDFRKAVVTGSRKANFGNVVTRRHRESKAEWPSFFDPPEDVINRKHLDTWLGISELGGMVPDLKDGRLVMTQKSIDEKGRRRRKAKTRVLSVPD